MKCSTKVRVIQRRGKHRAVMVYLSTVLQNFLAAGRKDLKTIEKRLRRGDTIESVPGVTYQVVEEDRS